MNALTAYLLAAMLTWAPIRIHDYTHVDREDTRQRYVSIATDMSTVVSDAGEPSALAGEDGRQKTALLALAIDSYESGGFRADVDTTTPSGDCHGVSSDQENAKASPPKVCHAVCLAQLWLRPGEHVESRQDCFRIELARIRESLGACQGLRFDEKLSVYASGNCTDGVRASVTRVRRATTWWSGHSTANAFQDLDQAKAKAW